VKAIIMAAGVGSRIVGSLHEKPKCLITADNESLIARMVRVLKSRGIDDITVITGYKSQLIHDELGTRVKYYFNPFYTVTNSIASLWLAKELLFDDVILMNADIYFEERVLDIALAQTKPAVMLSDCTRIEEGDFCFKVDGERLIKAGNNLSPEDVDCEYVGIVRIDSSFIAEFKTRLENMIEQGDFGDWWEGVLYSFLDQKDIVTHRDVKGAYWTEIDHMGEYLQLKSWLEEQKA